MTELEEVKAARDTLTTKLGDVVRQLAFSGIAVIWILKTEPTKTGLQFDQVFYRPLFWFLLCLAADLVQYPLGSRGLGWNRRVLDMVSKRNRSYAQMVESNKHGYPFVLVGEDDHSRGWFLPAFVPDQSPTFCDPFTSDNTNIAARRLNSTSPGREPEVLGNHCGSFLSATSWSWGMTSVIDQHGRIFIVDAHRTGTGGRFIVHSDELLTACLELESILRLEKV